MPERAGEPLRSFEGRRQLIVYRYFYEPDVTTYPEGGDAYPERGCVGCSFVADQVAHPAHLNARDTTLVFVSRAPQAQIQGLKERMGWDIPWYTITDNFDADFGVREWHAPATAAGAWGAARHAVPGPSHSVALDEADVALAGAGVALQAMC